MNLYVDDSRACPPGWTPAKTITEAIEILATQEVHAVSLDYDIDIYADVKFGKEKVPVVIRSQETFEPVARYIALMPEGVRPQVQYHTANPKGEAIMRDILDE
jgi:hypothetical protein